MSHNFSKEYELARDAIGSNDLPTAGDLGQVVTKLRDLMAADGFVDTSADGLTRLRKHVKNFSLTKMFTGKNAGEADNILLAAGAFGADDKKFTGGEAIALKASALKLLRHTYFVAKTGAKSLWVISVPKSYKDWPSPELKPLASVELSLKARLSEVREYFSSSNKKHMHEGAIFALAWVQKALIVLGTAGTDKGESMALVKRWFETSDTTEADLAKVVTDLTDGFKKIQAALNGNRLILTDYPPDRGTSDEKNTEAFVWNGAWKDSLKVVYIEQGFFARGANVLSGRDNWARIIVHELSHSEVGTDDYPRDNSYAWQGINPAHAKFNGNKAITNAENWAYFAADCAAALSEGERSTALQMT